MVPKSHALVEKHCVVSVKVESIATTVLSQGPGRDG